MLTGKSLRADKAKNMGVVNLLVDPLGPGLHEPGENTMRYLEEVAVGIAKDLAAGKIKAGKKVSLQDKILSYALQYNWVKDQIFGKAKAQVMKMSQGLYPAPLRVCIHNFTTFHYYNIYLKFSRYWKLLEQVWIKEKS